MYYYCYYVTHAAWRRGKDDLRNIRILSCNDAHREVAEPRILILRGCIFLLVATKECTTVREHLHTGRGTDDALT